MNYKKVFILLLALPILLISTSGCGSSQESEIMPTPSQESTSAPLESTPTPLENAPSYAINPPRASPPAPPPSPASPIDGKLFMPKAPSLGEKAEVTFSFYSHLISEKLEARVEFEKYDPSLYYPLGRGREREDKLQNLAKKLEHTDPYYLYIMEAAEEEPEISVPQEALLVSGDLNWEGDSIKEPVEIQLAATVRFPEEGEWLIKGWLEGEEGSGQTYDVMYLTINKDSGTFGWPKDYSKGSTWTPPDKEEPMSITIKPPRAPLLGDPFRVTMSVKSIKDLAQAEGTLEFFQMKGTSRITIPLEEILIDGNLAWQGRLEKDIPVKISGTVIFPEEGDWGILEWSRSDPESVSMNRNRIFLHVGKEESRFGWTESH